MNYLIKENGILTHYFYKCGEGLVKRAKRGSSWQESEVILKDATCVFGIYPDDNCVHIVTQTTENELMYIINTAHRKRKFILQKLSPECNIIKLFIYSIRNRLNMLYSVKHGDDILLMHCILTDNARPNTVAKLKDGHFFVISERVYYSIPDGSCGFSELSDEKPAFYIRIAQNCSVPYLHRGHIAYQSNGKIYFDNRELCKDSDAEGVIITEYSSRLFVVWQSNGYLRYMPADSPSNRPHAVIKPPAAAELYGIWHNEECHYFYGNHTGSDLTLYVNPSPFDSLPEKSPEEFLSRRMENMKKEIDELKHQLSQLA
ncbi:MAG: hypothetical protein KIG65_02775 [Eubacteriales bacterium]|nr:hypothetical protein [Eubacteriales bacterium]